jgi:DNA-binding transcriptional MerR regulator
MTRLSAKQLRSYDALGLLTPARVDPQTGYRSYHRAQARTAITIALLRSLDVPLATIADLLVADEGETRRLLDGERRRVEGELRARRRALDALAQLGADDELMPHVVGAAQEPERRLLVLDGRSDAERLHRDATALVGRLAALLPHAAQRPVIGLYPLDLDGDVAFSVGVEADDAPTGPDAGLRALVLPGGPVASVLHTGPHEELPLAYYPLLAWVQERGLVASGPVRERHLDDPADTAPEHLRTEVSIPVHDPGDPT